MGRYGVVAGLVFWATLVLVVGDVGGNLPLDLDGMVAGALGGVVVGAAVGVAAVALGGWRLR